MSGANFKLQGYLEGHQSSVSSLRFDPVLDRWLLSASSDVAVKAWKHETGGCLFTGKVQNYAQKIPGRMKASRGGDGHCDAVLCIDGHPRTPTIASGSKEKDTTIRIWTDIVRI